MSLGEAPNTPSTPITKMRETNPLTNKKPVIATTVDFGYFEGWGRMAIVDTKPFKLRVILHRIFVERPQVTGIPAWPGGAACYRRSRYIL